MTPDMNKQYVTLRIKHEINMLDNYIKLMNFQTWIDNCK